MKLTAHQHAHDEIYTSDFARIPESYRLDRHKRPIEKGVVCSLECDGKEVFVIARGCTRSDAAILLDSMSPQGKVMNFR